MRKFLLLGCLIGGLTLPSTVMASSVTLVNGVQYVKADGEAISNSSTPEIRIVLDEAYKKAGKTEKVTVTLEGAEWNEGKAPRIYDLENLKRVDIAAYVENPKKLVVSINVPENITEEDEIAFTLPIDVLAYEKEIYIEARDSSETLKKQKILVATEEEKKLTWEVGTVLSFTQEGTLAPITFKEVNAFALGSQEVEITMKLNDQDVEFGDFKYSKVNEGKLFNTYTVDIADYVTYGDGFSGQTSVSTMKIRKAHEENEIVLTLKGVIASEIGSITISNLPIRTKTSELKDKTITMEMKSDQLVGKADNIVVAERSSMTEEEKKAALEEAERQQAKQEKLQQEEEEKARLYKSSIQFKIGEKSYSSYGKTKEMDAAAYIEEPGYTMVPIRYVAEAIGIYDEDISYINGELYFRYNGRTIQLTTGSPIARINQAEIKMAAPVVIKDGRSYAPIGEVAKILGLSKEWNSHTQTAIFYK